MSLLTFDGFILTPIIFIGILTGLGIWIYLWYKNKNKHGYILAPILFLLHSLLFFTLSELNLIPKDVYIIWRHLLYIHCLTIFILVGACAIQLTGGKKQ